VEAVFDRHATVETTRRLTHGDFHAGNVLWADGVVSGVVDWSTTRIGDPLFDLAYLRLDSTVVYGAAAGEAMVGAYEDASGRTVDDLEAWDLLAATIALPDPGPWAAGPTDLGRTDLDVDTVVDRYREHVARLLSG
jgi:aminoglycoside phosphotransferase (APT) family kinase protein